MTFLDEVRRLAARHRQTGILLDTNVFLVLLIGAEDPDRISECSLTSKFDATDLQVLTALLGKAPRLVTTPHVATELSNLIGQAKGGDERTTNLLATLALYLGAADERRHELRVIFGVNAYRRLGLTDAALVMLSRRPPLVITDDEPLYSELASLRRPVIYYTDLRREVDRFGEEIPNL